MSAAAQERPALEKPRQRRHGDQRGDRVRSRSRTRSSSRSSSSSEPILVEDRVTSPSGSVTVRNQYNRGRLLGKGGFAHCYIFKHLASNEYLAGKVVAKASLKKERAKQKLLSEIKIHKSLDHRHVVRFLHYFEDSTNVYIVLELCHNRTLMDLVKRRKRLTEPEVLYWLLQLLSGIEYLHANRVIHRDLKLGNIFITRDMQLRIGDLGLATCLATGEERKRTVCGTPNYIAPEILSSAKGGHSFEVDIWSLGCIVFTMLVGRPPFETRDVKSTYSRIKSNEYTFPESPAVSDGAKSLIRWMLSSDPAARPTPAQIRRHAFVTGNLYTLPAQLPEHALTTAPSFPVCTAEDIIAGRAVAGATTAAVTGDSARMSSRRSAAAAATTAGATATTAATSTRRRLRPADTNARVAPGVAATKRASNRGRSSSRRTSGENAGGGRSSSGRSSSSSSRRTSGENAAHRRHSPSSGGMRPAVEPAWEAVESGRVASSRAPTGTAAVIAPSPAATAAAAAVFAATTSGSAASSRSGRVARPRVPPATRTPRVGTPLSDSSQPLSADKPARKMSRGSVKAPSGGLGPMGGGRTRGERRAATAAADEAALAASAAAAAAAAAATGAADKENAVPGSSGMPRRLAWTEASTGGSSPAGSSSGGVVSPAVAGVAGASAATAASATSAASAAAAMTAAAATATAAVAESSTEDDSEASEQQHALDVVPTGALRNGAASTKSAPAATSTTTAATAATAAACRQPGSTRDRPQLPAAVAGPVRTVGENSRGLSEAAAEEGCALARMHDVLSQSLAGVPESEADAAAVGAAGAIGSGGEGAALAAHSSAGAGRAEAGAAQGGARHVDGPRRWVSKWVDYTQKYGVGYLLCDGSVGVYFNDATKIVLSSDGRFLEYIDRRVPGSGRREGRRHSVEPQAQRFPLDAYPRDDRGLEKKVKLLTHFRDYLNGKFATSSTRKLPEEQAARAAGSGTRDMIFVKKWLRAKHAIMFRLSDKTVQVNFFDNSEILLAPEANVVTYVDKHGGRLTRTLEEVTQSNRRDIQKRLRYTKDILAEMVGRAAPRPAAGRQ